MAKGQLRGNREAKKPKQPDKPKKALSPTADLAWVGPKPVAGKPAKKK